MGQKIPVVIPASIENPTYVATTIGHAYVVSEDEITIKINHPVILEMIAEGYADTIFTKFNAHLTPAVKEEL